MYVLLWSHEKPNDAPESWAHEASGGKSGQASSPYSLKSDENSLAHNTQSYKSEHKIPFLKGSSIKSNMVVKSA